jgi:Mce-associated membrane protein
VPTNRRSGTNRQPAARRPKVAGLRKRPTSPASPEETAKAEEEDQVNGTAVTEQPEAAEPEAADAAPAETATAETPAAEPETAKSETAETETAEPEPQVSEAVAADEPSSAQDSPAAEPEKTETEDAETESSKSDVAESGDAGKPWVLWGVTALLFALAIFFGVSTYTTYNTGPAANEALTSAGATSEVNGQVSDGIEKLFSYDFNDTAKTENAAKDLLVGPAVQKYDELFALVKQQAPQQQLIVTTTVKNSAVTRLEGDRAEVLVFVDQHAMRANTGESNIGPAQLSVSAEKQGDKWKITQLTLR